MKDLLNIRQACDADRNLILNSWLTSYYEQEREHTFRGVTKNCFMAHHRETILEVLGRSLVFCASDRHDPTQIYGWICIEPEDSSGEQVLHFVYIKYPFRHMGICKTLLNHALGTGRFCFTHKPTFGLAKFLFDNAKYNPYRFFRKKAA